jgi:hypothetical protein
MKTRKTSWLTMAALLWLWATLATAFNFTQLPSLFHLSEATADTAYSSWGWYELYPFVALVLFVFISRPSLKVWVATGCIGVLVLAKILWLEPLLYFRAQTVWNGQHPFNFLPLLYTICELTKTGLLLLSSSWIYRVRNLPAAGTTRTRRFVSFRELTRRQAHHPN